MPKLGPVLALAAISLVFLGCSPGEEAPEKVTVSGTVTVDGEPLKEGAVIFDSSDGKTGAAQGAVTDGKFEFESEPGAKKVLITAPPIPTGEKDQYGEEITENMIPSEYSAGEKLTADVKASGENTFNFEVKTTE